MTAFIGEAAVSVFQATVIASGLDLYRKTGMLPNRAYTPRNMMNAASALTGKKFKARDYEGAAKALREWAQVQAMTKCERTDRGLESVTVTQESSDAAKPADQ